MELVKGGLADKAGYKCELNVEVATRNDHINIRPGHPEPSEEKRRSLKGLENTRVAKKGKVYK